MLLCCCKPPARTRHRNSLSIFFSYDIESVTFGGDFIFVQRHDGNITGCWIPPNKLYLDAVGVLREINNNNSLFLTFNQKSFKFFSLLAFLLRTLERAKCGRSIAFPPPPCIFTMMRKLQRQLMNFTLRRLREKATETTTEKRSESRELPAIHVYKLR